MCVCVYLYKFLLVYVVFRGILEQLITDMMDHIVYMANSNSADFTVQNVPVLE